MIEYNMARCVWVLERDEIVEHLSGSDEQTARLWLEDIIGSLEHEDLTRVVVTLWAIWYARRKVIHENTYQSPLSTQHFVKRFVEDLPAVKTLENTSRTVGSTGPRWLPPPAGLMKINVDATLAKNEDRASASAVTRDGEGKYLGASALVIQGITDAEIMEAIACREDMALASDLVMQRFRLASDNSNVITSIKEGSLGIYGHVVQEIKGRASGFQVVEFVHERRASNVDAHNLARGSVYSELGRHVWLLTPPAGVCNSYNPSSE